MKQGLTLRTAAAAATTLALVLAAGSFVGCKPKGGTGPGSNGGGGEGTDPPPAPPAPVAPAPGTGAAPAPAAGSGGDSENRKLIRAATLSTVEQNNRFKKNIAIVKRQRENAIALKTKIDAATDPTEKQKLQAEFDKAMAKLNENNQDMRKAYNYTLNRNYIYVIEKSHIYMSVTPEEAAKFEAEMKKREAAAAGQPSG